MEQTFTCWCNDSVLEDFSANYSRCLKCHTLISKIKFNADMFKVLNDNEDLYGKNYWLRNQKEKYGQPDIYERLQNDLSDRCLYWLQTILKYKLPPAITLELGASHGGLVGLLTELGFKSEGLELSPWIANFATKTFSIPMRVGPIEHQAIEADSLDMIILMDVLEHLPNPTKTIQHCLTLLKEDGVLIIQTPNYPLDKTYEALNEEKHPFLSLLKPVEHLFLFNQKTIPDFFNQLSQKPLFIQFEPAIFAYYDMFFLVSKKPFTMQKESDIQTILNHNRHSRIIAAALAAYAEKRRYIELFQIADTDRTLRLQHIQELAKELKMATEKIMPLSNKKSFFSSFLLEFQKIKQNVFNVKNELKVKSD